MKKIISIFMVITCLLTLTGCSSNTDDLSEDTTTKPTTTKEIDREKEDFVSYSEKVIKDAKISYAGDSKASIPNAGVYIYDIKVDLKYKSTGDYQGFVVIDVRDINTPHYRLYLHNNEYMILNYDVHVTGTFPNSDDLKAYDKKEASKVMGSAVKVCNDLMGGNGTCYNRGNSVIS